MISISAIIFDIDGSIKFQSISADSDIDSFSRRVSRRATLDGGASFTDNGYSVADRDFIIRLSNIKKADSDKLKQLFKTHALLNLSTDEGFFRVVPESFNKTEDEVTLRLLSKALLSA